MTLHELLHYHAAESGLLDIASGRALASDAGFNVSEAALAECIEAANAGAIADALRGDILGARVFTTEDGMRFAEMACGTITDGDLSWSCLADFCAAMNEGGVSYMAVRQ